MVQIQYRAICILFIRQINHLIPFLVVIYRRIHNSERDLRSICFIQNRFSIYLMTRNSFSILRQKKARKMIRIPPACRWKSNDRAIYVHISYVITPTSSLLGTHCAAACVYAVNARYLCALISPFHRISLMQLRATGDNTRFNTHVST